MLFCVWTINRGPNRPLFPCLPCLSREKSPGSTGANTAPGPDLSVWAATPGDHNGSWGHKVYLTDLKRQSAAGSIPGESQGQGAGMGAGAGAGGFGRYSQSFLGRGLKGGSGSDQRVVDWQTGAGYSSNSPPDSVLSPITETSQSSNPSPKSPKSPKSRQGRKSARMSTNAPSPLGSSSGHGQPQTSSPASTFHSHTHLLPTVHESYAKQHQHQQPFRSPASTSVSNRMANLPAPVSPLVSSKLANTGVVPSTDRESFGHTPSMYASSIWSNPGVPGEEVSIPPRARMAYSPFAPRPASSSGSQRNSLRSIRGFAV